MARSYLSAILRGGSGLKLDLAPLLGDAAAFLPSFGVAVD